MPSLLNFTCHATWGSMTSWGMEQINLKLGTDWWSSMTSKIYVKFYAIFVITKIKRKMKELYWFTKVFSVSRPREGNYHCLETHSWYLAFMVAKDLNIYQQSQNQAWGPREDVENLHLHFNGIGLPLNDNSAVLS